MMRVFFAIIVCSLFIPKAMACEEGQAPLMYMQKGIHSYWQNACSPQNCSTIYYIDENPNLFNLKKEDELSSYVRSCNFNWAGKTTGKALGDTWNYIDDSSVGSFVKGLWE